MAPQLHRQSPDQGGEDRSVGPVQTRCRIGSAKHGDLVAQHQQLDVLGRGRSAQQDLKAEHALEDQI